MGSTVMVPANSTSATVDLVLFLIQKKIVLLIIHYLETGRIFINHGLTNKTKLNPIGNQGKIVNKAINKYNI